MDVAMAIMRKVLAWSGDNHMVQASKITNAEQRRRSDNPRVETAQRNP